MPSPKHTSVHKPALASHKTQQSIHTAATRRNRTARTTARSSESRSSGNLPTENIYKIANILTATENFIVHQCNCTSKHAAGLARQIFQTFPNANTYTSVPNNRRPGEISIHHQQTGTPSIVNIYGQYYPGAPQQHGHDNATTRQRNFTQALHSFADYLQRTREGIVSIAIPHKIGCGLAAGIWPIYHRMILEFQDEMNNANNTHCQVRITFYKYLSLIHISEPTRPY